MKSTLIALALLVLSARSSPASVILTTSNPPGTPLTMAAGTTSGAMSVSIASNDAPNDVVAAWQFSLLIVPQAGSTGVLTFQDPQAGDAPIPPGYVFGTDGLGIVVPSNTGLTLNFVNDFYSVIDSGVPVSSANLLLLDFFASSNASGLFGVYAVRGDANTVWSDPTYTTQYFSNVPSGTGNVLIGEVLVQGAAQPVPEPATLVLLFLFGGISLACRRGTV